MHIELLFVVTYCFDLALEINDALITWYLNKFRVKSRHMGYNQEQLKFRLLQLDRKQDKIIRVIKSLTP